MANQVPFKCRRDVIKAESAALSVPELDLEVTTGVFGGLVTTVEGLVVAVRWAAVWLACMCNTKHEHKVSCEGFGGAW